ncbi:tRNA (guanine(37)-N1)-methyltransferase 1, partial [Olea europaea subsp. europaea]
MPLDEAAFTRVFDISALRVPSDLCFSLESRLCGHLLNWPRTKNIARVPGDEIDEQLKNSCLSRKRKEGLTGMRWHCRRLLQRKRTVKRMIKVVLLGEEFKPKWKGPTRLLLLDEANEDTRDLPESIK